MAQYQQTRKDDGSINPNLIFRIDDDSFIPADPVNIDYQDFLAWQAAGHTPLPPAPPVVYPAQVEYLAQIAKAIDEDLPLRTRFAALLKVLGYMAL